VVTIYLGLLRPIVVYKISAVHRVIGIHRIIVARKTFAAQKVIARSDEELEAECAYWAASGLIHLSGLDGWLGLSVYRRKFRLNPNGLRTGSHGGLNDSNDLI